MKTMCRCLLALAGAAFMQDACADGLTYWIGGTSGNFKDNSNWSGGSYPSTYNFTVVVTNTEPVTISLGSNLIRVNGVKVSGANHKFTSSGGKYGFMFGRGKIWDDKAVVDVAEGCTVTMPPCWSRNTAEKDLCPLYKTGGGTAVFPFYMGTERTDGIVISHFTKLDISEGRVEFSQSSADMVAAFPITGPGDFVKSGAWTQTVTGGIFSVTGRYILESGGLNVGSGEAGEDATGMENLKSLEMASGSALTFRNVGDTDWTHVAVFGYGSVTNAGAGVVTIGDLSLTNGVFNAASATQGAEFVVNGGTCENLQYARVDIPFRTVFNGGDFKFKDYLFGTGYATFLQTGGKVTCILQGLASASSNEVYYTMTGGELVSRVDRGVYPQGVGLDLSGTAKAELRNDFGGSYYHRLSSGDASHTIRLRDDARLSVDYLLLAGEVNATGLGTLDLQGGVMEVSGWIGMQTGMQTSSAAYAEILFDGGVLRKKNDGSNRTWSNYNDRGHITGYVRAGGAFIDVPADSQNVTLTLTWPFVSDVESGVDGGLVKTGLGTLSLKEKVETSGAVKVLDGTLALNSTDAGTHAAGTGDILVGGGIVKFNVARAYAACTASGATFAYTNAASLVVKNGASLVFGAEGAAADSVLHRSGHGVLFVGVGDAGKTLGTDATVTVNGGLSLDASTGLPKAPVFLRRQLSGSGNVNVRRTGFLSCDATGSLGPLAAVAFDPTSSTASTVAEITSSAVRVDSDTAVGALNLEYSGNSGGLVIADDATLHVGSGNALSVAPVLMNGVTTADGASNYQSINGGTIDFGASEGVIVLNNTAVATYPFRIDSVISGSGGMTFAAPANDATGFFRGAVALGKASSYTGGTWIENACVVVEKSGGLGTGRVCVEGSMAEGGSLVIGAPYDSETFGNEIVLSGRGPVYSAYNKSDREGALVVRKGTRFTGGIELADDAVVVAGCRGGATVTEFASGVTGAGALIVRGLGTLRLSAANSYAGGTIVEEGVLEVDDAGTLGTGPVEVKAGARLRFVNSSVKQVPNPITGEGTVECAGGEVVFADRSGFEGEMSGAAAFVTDGNFVKTGTGSLVVAAPVSWPGTTAIDEGTVVLGGMPSQILPAADSIAFHLDATQGVTLSDGSVVEWADADGRAIAFTNDAAHAPVLSGAALNGRDVLDFKGTELERLVANAPASLHTVFIVNRGGTGTPPKGWSNAGLIGAVDSDMGLRMESGDYMKNDTMFRYGLMYRNGSVSMEVNSFWDRMYCPVGEWGLNCVAAGMQAAGVTFAIGDYFGNTSIYKRPYYGQIAEIVAYDRILTDDERKAVERHLADKWNLDVATGSSSGILPSATSLAVAADGTLDLNGCSQTVASMNGNGSIVNSSTRRATLELASGTSVFTGTVGDNIELVIGPGATLDLAGGTLHVPVLRRRGRIVNGTVTADVVIHCGTVMSFR